ncbi:helix-turn-helix domain-containing protein [Streptomyces sp. NPDC088726]|uniref:helix-turn-helix domain-containing protein n=1 Tax=Streptomyces sp. NPDC088726 TaxID=3365874 RepID=UPI0038034133
MGRPEGPVIATRRPILVLAQRLREQRGRAGLSLRELAEQCDCSEATLSRATSGRVVPTLRTVESWGKACDIHETEAARTRGMWIQARAAVRGSGRKVQLDLVQDFNDLRRAMKALRALAGSPSLRELARLAPGREPLTKSTISNILLGRHPPRLHQLCSFVAACGIDRRQCAEWVHAWHQADRATRSRRLSPRGSGYTIAPVVPLESELAPRIVGPPRGPTLEDVADLPSMVRERQRRRAVESPRSVSGRGLEPTRGGQGEGGHLWTGQHEHQGESF